MDPCPNCPAIQQQIQYLVDRDETKAEMMRDIHAALLGAADGSRVGLVATVQEHGAWIKEKDVFIRTFTGKLLSALITAVITGGGIATVLLKIFDK